MKNHFDPYLKKILSASLLVLMISNTTFILAISNPCLYSVDLRGITSFQPENKIRNKSPVPLIKNIKDSIIYIFNHQILHLEASESYDPDGFVDELMWQIGEETYHGKVLEYQVNEKIPSINPDRLPVFNVLLIVIDNLGGVAIKNLLVKVLPDKIHFLGNISLQSFKVKPNLIFFRRTNLIMKMRYVLDVPPSNIIIHLRMKKIIPIIREIKLYSIDGNGKLTFLSCKKNILLSKNIEMLGKIRKRTNISGFKLEIRGPQIKSYEIDQYNSYIEFSHS